MKMWEGAWPWQRGDALTSQTWQRWLYGPVRHGIAGGWRRRRTVQPPMGYKRHSLRVTEWPTQVRWRNHALISWPYYWTPPEATIFGVADPVRGVRSRIVIWTGWRGSLGGRGRVTYDAGRGRHLGVGVSIGVLLLWPWGEAAWPVAATVLWVVIFLPGKNPAGSPRGVVGREGAAWLWKASKGRWTIAQWRRGVGRGSHVAWWRVFRGRRKEKHRLFGACYVVPHVWSTIVWNRTGWRLIWTDLARWDQVR